MFFADDGAAFGELEAELVLGAAFAGDLNALDFEFEFFLAVGPAADDGELGIGAVRSGDALEHVVADGDLDCAVEDRGSVGIFGRGGREAPGGFFAVGGEFGPVLFFESAQSGDVGFNAEAFGGGLGDFLDDFAGGEVKEQVVELGFLVGSELV